ncbi:MAG TPA: hypothetical protein VFV43_10225 [Limnobacter sp.]|nr:hypothetical protein [Limnobacter sp.]
MSMCPHALRAAAASTAQHAMLYSQPTIASKQFAFKAIGKHTLLLLMAFPGGLLLSNLLAATLGIGLAGLGMAQSESMVLALLICYVLWPCWLLWVYCTQSLPWLLIQALGLGVPCTLVLLHNTGRLW